MNILHYFCIVLCLHSSFSCGFFSYDRAVYAAQKGDMQIADDTLQKIIINSPDKADVLYDAGIVAHNLTHGAQAAAYFTRAADYAQDDDNLRFKAHFNAGNACVDTKNLQDALTHFDKALEIQPDDQYARHNRDRVAQMLQEQEQQKNDNQKKNDDQKKDQDQDHKKDQQQDKDQQQNKDQSNNGDNNNKENDGNDQQQGGDDGKQQQNQKNKSGRDQSDEKSDKKSDENSQDEQGNDSKKDDRGTQGKNNNRDTQKREQDSANNQEGNGKQDLEKESQRTQQEREKQQGKQHGKTPDTQKRPQDKTNATAADTQEKGIDDPWLMRILDEREQNDKKLNKQLMEAKVRQQGGKNGKNCW